jgi:hypothetical protein
MNISLSAARPWALEPAKAMQAGLKRHGISVPITSSIEPADLTICWGMNQARQAKGDYLLMERAFLGDRNNWISLGYNGLNGYADFCNKNSPSDRWDKYWSLEDWTGGDYILVTTQIPGDNSLVGIDLDYQKIVDSLQFLEKPIHIRSHPQRPQNWGINGAIVVDPKIPIEEAVKNAYAVVTINSNSGVDAIVNGTPVLNYNDRSMVWDLAMKKPEELLNPSKPNRTQWAYDIAYAQWLPKEISNGDAWEHLKKFYV